MIKIYFWISITILFASCGESVQVEVPIQLPSSQDTIVPEKPVFEYGFCLDSFEVHRGEIKQDWTLSHLLLPFNVSQLVVNEASERSKDSLVDLSYITTGKNYMMLCDKMDTANTLQYCVYDKNIYEYVVFDFTDSVRVYKVERPVEEEEKQLTGIIKKGSNLSNEIQAACKDIGVTSELVTKVAQTFAWSIDFFRLYPEDKFKVIYDEKSVEGKVSGTGRIKALFFEHKGKTHYAFAYNQDDKLGYYDEEGNSNKSLFLMAPLKYTRMSSPYSKRRFHPVQKRWKAHLGTDYAASKGTPIWATADGTVIAATYSKNNGYYVKLKHNKVYTTQYLHMSKIAKGMKKGRTVLQGETIGYVGSTGLATGPHVCYRFWKNGKQIDHRKEVHHSSEPLEDEHIEEYLKFIEPLKKQLDEMAYPQHEETESLEVDSLL